MAPGDDPKPSPARPQRRAEPPDPAADLLRELRVLGVQLTVAGSKLKVRAPHGVLTERLRDEMATHRQGLVRLLALENP